MFDFLSHQKVILSYWECSELVTIPPGVRPVEVIRRTHLCGGRSTSAAAPGPATTSTTSNSFETGWMDLAVAFATNQTENGDGCLDGTLDSSLNADNNATFGVESVGSNEYIVVKVEADASWSGNISSMSISWT